jgi:hypothetical protein
MLNNMWIKAAFAQEKSIFHTNEPRDTRTKVHLLLLFSFFICALTIAIVFAEGKISNLPMAAQKPQPNKEQDRRLVYGKSE